VGQRIQVFQKEGLKRVQVLDLSSLLVRGTFFCYQSWSVPTIEIGEDL
jgi:hypothetical protein